MGARTVLWIGGCMWSYVCTRGSTPSPPILEKKWVCLSVSLGGWVEKMGARFGKKGGGLEKPPPDGGKWGWIGEGGKKPPGTLGSPWSERGSTEPVGTRQGGGMGFCPSDTLPSPYGTPNRFLEALWNILEPLDVHTPLPTHPCVHVEALAYRLQAIDLCRHVCPGAYPGSRKPEIPRRKSLCDARAGITTRMRDNPLRARDGSCVPTMGVPPSVFPSTLACATSRSVQCISTSPSLVGRGGCIIPRGRPCAPPSPPRPPCTCTRMPT